jgi:ATP-binding cassette subfamily F protein 3
MALIAGSQLSLYYSDIEIFSNVTFEVKEKSHIGIVGPNGSGKTSFLKVLMGDQDYDEGEIFKSDTTKIGYVPQTSLQSGNGTIKNQIEGAFKNILDIEKQMQESATQIQNTTDSQRKQAEIKYANLLDKYESSGGYTYKNTMDKVISGLGLSKELLNTPIKKASGGERTRAALAKALLTEPDLLILDEPTNYLDFKGLNWLETFLSHFSNSFIIVSHDRYFLDKVAKYIWEIDKGNLQSYKGNYSQYKILKLEEEKRLAKEYEKQQVYIKKTEDFIARYHAGQRSKEARGRAKKLSKIDKLSEPIKDKHIKISGSNVTRTGEIVLRTESLSVGYETNGIKTELFSVPDCQIMKETTTAIIGNNGEGKTTLIKTIIGDINPISGNVHTGHNVSIGYFRQGADNIPDDFTVLEALLEIKNLDMGEARNFLAKFLFVKDEIFNQVKSLSGGERGRLELARLLITSPNVLVLDEPTTHLDIPSREALEIMLSEFEGTTIFVSHDRHLISLLAENIWVINGSNISQFEGTYSEWLSQNEIKGAQTTKINTTHKNSVHPKNKKTSSKSQKSDLKITDELIESLESDLKFIEHEIELASKNSNVDKITELGKRYKEVSGKLDEAVKNWGIN